MFSLSFQFLCNALVRDFESSGIEFTDWTSLVTSERNNCSQAAHGGGGGSGGGIPPHACNATFRTDAVLEPGLFFFLEGLTRYDSQLFLFIASRGYSEEKMVAFFPLYPFLIRVKRLIIKKIAGTASFV